MVEASKEIKAYMKKIDKEVRKAYKIANAAKSKGFDPNEEVKIPLAENMAERVEGLISAVAPQIKNSGVVERIAELEREYGTQDWRVALKIAEEVAKQKFCKFDTEKEAMETGIRLGLAYVTVGVVASPLEGFVELKIKKRKDEKQYFCLMYSGPIRSAGGTAGAVSTIIADYVRTKMGYAPYDPTEKEIKRTSTELTDYHERVTNLQYYPSQKESEFLTANLPVQISGDPSEEFEVSNYKDLPRIETNRIRSGFCLVMGECLSLKAPKLWKQLSKWAADFNLQHWNFLEKFIQIQKKVKAKGAKVEEEGKISPDYTYIKDLPGGRPVITHPLRQGGLRLRYGRCRTSGFSSDAIHPATMIALDEYIAIGTQLKTERPGKSTSLVSCDTIEGPTVKLKNGNVLKLETVQEAKEHTKQIEEILYLGDILINHGDFLNRAHKLIPCGFNEEWWMQLLKKNSDGKQKINPRKVSAKEAINLSKKFLIPLHPKHTYYWNAIKTEQFLKLFKHLKNSRIETKKIITSPTSEEEKRSLELIGIPHKVATENRIIIEGEDATALLTNLGNFQKKPQKKATSLEMINQISEVPIKDKLGTFIGARMGRPEKAKMRKLKGQPHTLFPVGKQGGRLRCFQSTLEAGKIKSQFPIRHCNKCNKKTIYQTCEVCETKTEQLYHCRECGEDLKTPKCKKHGECNPTKNQEIDIQHYFDKALKKLKTRNHPKLIKGVRGLTNKENIPENLVKGMLRAQHQICVNKDGTTRYDMTELGCTHFKPQEINVPVEKLKKLGYKKDCHGKELENENQILELKPQDIILPACPESPDEGADEILFRVSKFIDDLLVKLYKQKKYYNLKNKEALVGHLVVALSPHTSAGMTARIIGFSKTQGMIAHPLFHSILRRDCDGDEAAVMLLMDMLLNFSKKFLPSSRGATQDAPLVLTSKLVPAEVDDMVFDMDTAWEYPLELYEAAEAYKQPWDVKVEKFGNYLGSEKQYEGLGFTHDTTNFNEGVVCSAYKMLPTMREKVFGQMLIAEKLRAVDTDDVARLVVERHFLRDVRGNLRKFSMQQFRCVSCNEKYRRPPLVGKCIKCSGKIIFTIAEGSIVKYLEPSISLAEKYNLPPYLKQSLELLKARVESIFGRDAEKQENLEKWFSS